MIEMKRGISSSAGTDSDRLRTVTPSSPVLRTLDALAAMAARLDPSARSAILLLHDDRVELAAEYNLLPADRTVVRRLAKLPGSQIAIEFTVDVQGILKPLITQAAELIGWVVLFGIDETAAERLGGELDDVCWIATLAIEQNHLLEDIAYRAHHDSLTHLWNRGWMEEEIDRILGDGARHDQLVGLAQIGIDSFRVINDVLGHHVGNELLRQVAERFSAALQSGHLLARGTGDEFMVLMQGLRSGRDATSAAQALLASLDEVFWIGDHELIVRATIGTATTFPGSCSAAELQSQSSLALRYAKKQSRGRIVMFAPSMVTIPPERLVMQQHLRFASQKREFQLYYQPQIDLATGKLIGAEALLRWNHPWLGFISPATFIPIAEEIGIIEEIGDWALDEAIRFQSEWRSADLGLLRLAVNVSAIQLSRSEFASSVARRLRLARIEPEEIELEITESAVMENFEHGLKQMRLLRSLGVAIAIDDFGTGHSSLAYLQDLPIQRLKIDRAFVREIRSADERPPLVSSIIQLSHALGLSVIAEGVETSEQLRALAAMKCEEIQGFFVSKPLPGDAFLKWARERTRQRTALPIPA